MPFAIDEFAKTRPFLYHVTARANVQRLRNTRIITPAADLLRAGGMSGWLRRKRDVPLEVPIEGGVVILKDQAKLSFASADLKGCTEADFIEYLNGHVFFWPGKSQGPIRSGSHMQRHYDSDDTITIRVPTQALRGVNQTGIPLFCKFNSGAPRHQPQGRVARHLRMFVPCEAFSGAPSGVVEVGFRGPVTLPDETEITDDSGTWRRLCDRPVRV